MWCEFVSNKIIVIVDIVFTKLHKVETIVSNFIILDGSDQPLEFINVESFASQRVVIQRINDLLLYEMKHFEPVKVHSVSPLVLDPLSKWIFLEDRVVLAILRHPMRFNSRQSVVEIPTQLA